MKKCPVCKKEVVGPPDKVYCSLACKAEAANARKRKGTVFARECIICGDEFFTKNYSQKKCPRCKSADKKSIPLKDRTCAACGRVFDASSPNQKYCSNECKRAVAMLWALNHQGKPYSVSRIAVTCPRSSLAQKIDAAKEQGISYGALQAQSLIEKYARVVID